MKLFSWEDQFVYRLYSTNFYKKKKNLRTDIHTSENDSVTKKTQYSKQLLYRKL